MGGIVSSIFGGHDSYKAKLPPGMTQDDYDREMNRLKAAVSGAMMGSQSGLQGANRTLGQQQLLANQLLQQGQGFGPNPALDQLRMTTNANIANQMGLAASQRGVNPALAARMAGQNAANLNQNAAGQAALQSAQQQLGAQQAAGNLLGGMAGTQMQMAGLGTQQEALRRAAQNALQGNINNAWNNMQSINAGVSSQNANTAGQYGMGLLGGAASMLGGFLNKGGVVENPFAKALKKKAKGYSDGGMTGYADGGQVGDLNSFLEGQFAQAPQYFAPVTDDSSQFLNAMRQQVANTSGKNFGMMAGGMNKLGSTIGSLPGRGVASNSIGGTPGLGGIQGAGTGFTLSGAAPLANAGMGGASLGGGLPMAALLGLGEGGVVGGQAKVGGDSKKNDVVPALLSPGEAVIPRSKMADPATAHMFLDGLLRHTQTQYEDILNAQRQLKEMYEGGVC